MPRKKDTRFTVPPTPVPQDDPPPTATTMTMPVFDEEEAVRLARKAIEAQQREEERLLAQAVMEEQALEAKDQARDRVLWEEEAPDSKAQARFLGNLSNRLLRGISRKNIEAMTVRDRVSGARACYEMKQLELNKPTANIQFHMRGNVLEMIPKLQEELQRRERERQTINVTPSKEIHDAETG